MSQNKVSLNPCFYWTCDNCGSDSYYYPIAATLSEEDLIECREVFGPDFDPANFKATLIPKTVICKHCKASFDVENEETDII